MFPPVGLTRLEARKVMNGMEAVVGTVWGHPLLQDGGLVRLYDPEGAFLGVG